MESKQLNVDPNGADHVHGSETVISVNIQPDGEDISIDLMWLTRKRVLPGYQSR